MKLFIYGLAVCGFFFSGTLVWRLLQGVEIGAPESDNVPERLATAHQKIQAGGVLATVDGVAITSEDLDWEYGLHTLGLQDRSQLTPIPDLGSELEGELQPLRERILAALVERKVLYGFLRFDHQFNKDDPSRYTQCLEDYAATLESRREVFTDSPSRKRLKARICESSLITQYLNERHFKKISVDPEAIVTYYKDNLARFHRPAKVQIRQVLLPSESAAKKVRHRIRSHNFASVARQHSIAPEATEGGLLGPFGKSEMPAVFGVAFRMRPRQISDILKSTYGYHIIMVERRIKAKDLSLDEARPMITKILHENLQKQVYRRLVDQALGSIEVASPKVLW